MKITGITTQDNGIIRIPKQQQQNIQIDSKKDNIRKQQTDVNKSSYNKSVQLKPRDVLSDDELSMLRKLFPSDIINKVQGDVYSLKRKRVINTNLGNLIDVKS